MEMMTTIRIIYGLMKNCYKKSYKKKIKESFRNKTSSFNLIKPCLNNKLTGIPNQTLGL